MNIVYQHRKDRYKEKFGEELPSYVYEASISTEWIVSETDAEEINSRWGEGTVNVGDKGKRLLEAKTKEEAWERFVKLYAQIELECLEIDFYLTYEKPYKEIVDEILNKINYFIVNAENESKVNAFERPDFSCPMQEYLRLKYGYYISRRPELFGSSLASRVYGEYFLFKEWLEVIETIQLKNEPTENDAEKGANPNLPVLRTNKFKTISDVFTVDNWKDYISVLEKTEPALLNSAWEFVGKPKLHKGVICAWFKSLQYQGIIKLTINRSQLATVLNNQFANFNLGKDGKTFDNSSKAFENNFKQQIKNILK